MPVYHYRCKSCKAEHEKIQSISEGDAYLTEARCEVKSEESGVCSGELERLLGAGSFKLQGRGWFRDGYR